MIIIIAITLRAAEQCAKRFGKHDVVFPFPPRRRHVTGARRRCGGTRRVSLQYFVIIIIIDKNRRAYQYHKPSQTVERDMTVAAGGARLPRGSLARTGHAAPLLFTHELHIALPPPPPPCQSSWLSCFFFFTRHGEPPPTTTVHSPAKLIIIYYNNY